MKKNLNIIQIRGTRGIIMAICVVSCLVAGFVVFPGYVLMQIWNTMASHMINLPLIGLIQGILLWAILVAAYFTFRKDKLIVCVKSPQGLSEEELKSVFAHIKEQAEDDIILKSMLKSRETELKLNMEQADIKNNENCEKVNETQQ